MIPQPAINAEGRVTWGVEESSTDPREVQAEFDGECPALNFALSHPEAYERMRQEGQAAIDAYFEPHRNRQRAEQEARWAREGDA